MMGQFKKFQMQFMDWWNKFEAKQKTIIVCIGAGVVFAFVLLFTMATQPQYKLLAQCNTTKEASEITSLLDGADIGYRPSEDGMTIEVLEKNVAKANLLLGANDIPTDTYALDKVFEGGFSVTEADKQKKYKLYAEEHLESELREFDFIKDAMVKLTIPEEDGSLLSKEEESFASIILDIDGELPEDAPYAIAMLVKNGLGNKSSSNVIIVDTAGDMLYSGEDSYSVTGSVSNQMEVTQRSESIIANKVKKVLLGTGQFSEIEVAPNLVIDFSGSVKEDISFYPSDGKETGMPSQIDSYSSISEGGTGGVPGTDANDETTYQFGDGNRSTSEQLEESIIYQNDQTKISENTPPGSIEFGESSISVSAFDYKIIREEELAEQGLLEGTTWEQYQATNNLETKIEIDDELYEMVSHATGIAIEDIKIMAYEKPMFMEQEGSSITATDIGIIILVILVIGLLIFVVLSSMRSEKVVEEEEELSVESLLQSTPSDALDTIEMGEKSEKRRIIEAFVDANPESVANLLRNWLGEEWNIAVVKTKSMDNKISGTQKSAILLIVLGPERSSTVFKHLKEEEIEELTLEIANTRSITPQMKEAVIDEFYEICLAQQYIAEGGIGYAKELLEKALGDVKAKEVISKLTASLQVKPFEFVRKTEASQLLNFIQDEHPQTIALILSYLSAAQSSQIISALPLERQPDVAKRIALMDRTSPDVVKEVERVLESRLASLVNQDYTIIGGVDQVVEILNAVDRGTEKYIMENLEIEAPELADEIRKKMFVFEDILLLDDRAIQRVLRDVDNNDLGLSLKGSNEQVQAAIFNNLSKRLATMIKEDMEFMGPVRMKDVEEAQQKIVNIIRKLEDSSEIVISRGGGDEIIV